MSATVTPVPIPREAAIYAQLTGAHFHDAYAAADMAPQRSALQTWLDVVTQAPQWTRQLMRLRNHIVRRVGLKDLGQLDDLAPQPQARDAAHYRVGDRVGIFQIRHLSEREVILGQDDRHLNVQVSLHKCSDAAMAYIVVSTVVHVHNWLGHAYMAVVKPFHRRICKTLLAQASTRHHGPKD